jgi:fatty-acyl-CoA synthase
MSFPVIPHAETAFETQLLLKDLLPTFDFLNRTQEIIYGHHRFDYNMFRERIARLANALSVIGVEGGDTVAVLDWDSHRYLECFFAIPMLGAILHTVNIRLSTEQILYTINDASDKVILIHEDFVPTAEKIRDRNETQMDFVKR